MTANSDCADISQMDFGLGALFDEQPSNDAKSGGLSSAVTPGPDNIPDSGGTDDALGCLQTMFEDTMTGIFDEHMSNLTQDRDHWKMKAEEHAQFISVLEKRIASKTASLPPRDPDIANRLRHLEQENRQLSTRNKKLEDELCNLRREKSLVDDENDGKSRKLRGANKKVKNAKDAAAKERDKADDALNQRKLRLDSERKMRKELKAAEAKVATFEKEIENLRAKLHMETTGYPHLRDDGSVSDEATVAFTVQFPVYRQHFQKLRSTLEQNREHMTERLVEWYSRWKKPVDDKAVVGAVHSDSHSISGGDDIYEDNELAVYEEYPQTGAEHDGWRSKPALQAVIQQAMDVHNGTS